MPDDSNERHAMSPAWDTDIVQLLEELSAVQSEVFALVDEKRLLLGTMDGPALAAMVPREEAIVERLQRCHERRGELLARASQEGLPDDSLRSLSTALPREQRLALVPQLDAADSRARLLRHHSLTNWMVVQRTLLHLSRMIEIIATGGRLQPTYDKGPSRPSGGTMLDQAA